MTPVTISIPSFVSPEYFMSSYQNYYGDILKFARLQEKADILFKKAKDIFVDNEKNERDRFEDVRQSAWEDSQVLFKK